MLKMIVPDNAATEYQIQTNILKGAIFILILSLF